MAGIFLPGASKGGDITGVTAGDGLSGGGDSGGVTVTLDLNGLTAAVVADGDFIPIIDTNDSNGSRKEAVHDLATLFAGDGLEAANSVMTIDRVSNGGLEIQSGELSVAQGISQYDVAQFAASVDDNDFLRIATTSVEGLSASETLAAISAAPAAGDGNILTVGALDSGSITSGFTSIDVGSGGITTTGAIAGGTIDATTDFTIGTLVITDLTIVMTPSTSDTVTVAAATNGVLNITTVDNAATAANLNFIIDGAVDVDAAGGINLDSGSGVWTFEDSGTEMLRFTESGSGDITVKLVTNAKDLIFTDNGDATGLTVKDGAVGIVVPGEVMTTKISYTDGDDAMTVADGGGVTFAQDVTTTSHKYINLPENSSIKFTDQIGTDNSADNDDGFGIIFTFKTGATVTPFSPVYLAADNLVEEADADAIATMPCIGISMNASDVTINNDIEVMLLGLIRHDSFADFATAGAPVYVDGGASGRLATVAPSDADDVVQIVGHSIAEDTIFVQPSLSYVVVG